MKNHLLIFLFTLYCAQIVIAQEKLTMKTKFSVTKCYRNGDSQNCIRKLVKKEQIKEITKVNEIEEIVNDIPRGTTKTKKTVTNTEIIKQQVLEGIPCDDCVKRNAFLKLVKDTLYVNYYLNSETKREDTYFFELKNRETFAIKHRGLTLSALTIPIKYRPPLTRKNGNKVEEEFSASFNANLLLSYTFDGKSKFTYLKNVDNSIRDRSWRVGLFSGISTVKLDSLNTQGAEEARRLPKGREITKGLFSVGGGITYTYNSLSFGAFMGWDWALGNSANIWDYDGAYWFGLSIGFDILKFGKVPD